MKKIMLLRATLAASVGVAMLLTMSGCFYGHDDRDHRDDHRDDHHDEHQADVHVDVHHDNH